LDKKETKEFVVETLKYLDESKLKDFSGDKFDEGFA